MIVLMFSAQTLDCRFALALLLAIPGIGFQMRKPGGSSPGALSLSSKVRSTGTGRTGRCEGNGRDDDLGVSVRILVCHSQCHLGDHAVRGDCIQSPGGAAGHGQGRLPAWQVDHTKVGEEHAAPEPGAERLGGGFLGGEAFGEGGGADLFRPPHGLGAFDVGEDPVQESVAVTSDRRLDPPNVADVGTEAKDHQPFARSTPLTPLMLRRPTITLDRCARSRTSTSTRASMKSCWRLTILRLAIAPSCLAIALVRLASVPGSLPAITLMRAVWLAGLPLGPDLPTVS